MSMKYIHFKNDNLDVIVQFSEIISHAQMAGLLGRVMDDNKVLSAGFVNGDYENTQCYGRSDSLNIESDPNDTKILCRQYSNY